MTTRPNKRWYGVTVDWGTEVRNENNDDADGLEVEMYAAGDMRICSGTWERATWPRAFVRWR